MKEEVAVGPGDLRPADMSEILHNINTDLYSLVVVLDRAADLDGGALVHGGHAANLQLDSGLCRVGLDKVLTLLGLDLRVRDVETLLRVALLLHAGPVQVLPAGGVWPVYHLSEGEELLAPHLPVPPASSAPGGALGPVRRLPAGRTVHHGAELLRLGRGLRAGRVLQLDDVVVPVCHLLDTVHGPGLGAPAARLGAGGEVGHVPARRAGIFIAGAHLDLQSPARVTEVRSHGALLGRLHADHDGLL